MVKRNTSSSLVTTSKLQFYKAVFVPTILYGAECWSTSRSDITEMEKMNKKLLKWIVPYAICYKDAMIRLNVLPLPYFQVMKELLLLSNIVENKFDVNFSENYQRVSSRRGRLRFSLPKVKLLKSITMIYDAAAEESLLLLFDFSKAFDKINHGIMLKKLSLLGLDRNFYYIIKSYLTGRTQSVRIEDHLSAPRIVQTGVSQGSVLGLLFFLLYINDVLSIIYSSIALMFADDLKLFFRGTMNSLDQLQQDLINLELWNTQNHLLFNAKKCNMLVFNFQIPPSLKFMGNVLSDINSVKDL